MCILLHLSTCLLCIQVILLYPLQVDGSQWVALAKKHSFCPCKKSFLSTLLQNSGGTPPRTQRERQIDQTFIRFGRSIPSESNLGSDIPNVLQKDQDMSSI